VELGKHGLYGELEDRKTDVLFYLGQRLQFLHHWRRLTHQNVPEVEQIDFSFLGQGCKALEAVLVAGHCRLVHRELAHLSSVDEVWTENRFQSAVWSHFGPSYKLIRPSTQHSARLVVSEIVLRSHCPQLLLSLFERFAAFVFASLVL